MSLSPPSMPTWLGGGAAIGAVSLIIGAWQQIKSYFSYLWSFLVVKVEVVNDKSLHDSIKLYFITYFKRTPFGVKRFWGVYEYVRPIKKTQLIVFETSIPPTLTVFWKGIRPIFIDGSNDRNTLHISFIRGTFNFQKIIETAVDEYNAIKTSKNWKIPDRFRVIRKYGNVGSKQDSSRAGIQGKALKAEATAPDAPSLECLDNVGMSINRPVKWNVEDIGQPKKKTSFEDLYFKDNVVSAIKEAYLWRDNEEWFKSRGVPWKRGFLLESKPGCGKSAFVRALAQELNVPIVTFDLATMSNRDFTECWEDAMEYAPCIVLFEDIDAVFDGRKNVASTGHEQGLSFDCLLNTIDGVQNSDGIFKIFTTNNLEKVDPALGNPSNGEEMSTRPGRVDRVIHFDSLDEIGREKMAERILGEFPKEKWQHLFEKGKNDTGAQFQERCCRLALQLFWQEKHEEK